MTDFLTWWADHWPLTVVIWPAVYISWRWVVVDLLMWLKRRREP